jgi:hypothetical protein
MRLGFMAGQSIAFMENHQISARNLSTCRQNPSSTARFQQLQPRSKPRINDPAESRSNQQIHENHQIDHNHQIYQGICVIWKGRAVRFLPLVLAHLSEEISEELRQRRLSHSPSSAYSEGLQLCGVVAAAQVKERPTISVILHHDWCKACICPYSFRRLERKRHSFHTPHENHDRKTASGRAGTIEFERNPTMTCRIERFVIEEDQVILSISGRITERDVDTLRACLEQEGGAVAIDLKDVLLVDRGAVGLLALSELNGAELRNCPAYIREWVTRERAVINASEQGIEG